MSKTCSITNCERKHKGLGYCKYHYDNYKLHGDPLYKKVTHGMSHSPEYRAWCHMKERCSNPLCKTYLHYGGRGIKVCDSWQSFDNFFADMGNRPTPKHSLERIDNDGDYTPENCKWATKVEQVLNRRINKNNTSGYRGVVYENRRKHWIAQITINYKNKQLGSFETPEEAALAYQEALKTR